MRAQAEIEARLAKLSKDFDKYGRKPADTFSNAPRALMQTYMESEEAVLKWVLGIGQHAPKETKKS